MTATAPRVLVYSQDGLGLGHLRRTSSLVTELLVARPEACVLSVSDSPLGKFFATADNHDYVKLPSIRKEGPGDWRALSLLMPFREVLSMRRRMLRDTALDFSPDLLLVDHMPHGAMGELIPTLEALEDRETRVVLGLRDILDAPQVIRRRWALEGAYEAVVQHYDEVLVYGSRDVFDVAAEYGWPADAERRLNYCGYVCPPESALLRPNGLRRRYLAGRRDTRLVVATAGGGADAYPLLRALLEAVPQITTQLPVRLVMVTGPFMPPEQRDDLRRRARNLPVVLHSEVRNPLEHLMAADLVVSMAGYNTTTEIVRLGRPCLLVPRPGPSEEQRIRARLFAERGWARWFDPDQLPSGNLGQAVVSALEVADGGLPTPRRAVPPLDGRHTAAARMLSLLSGGTATTVLAASATSSPV
jgi:predicted glycosyltransferase